MSSLDILMFPLICSLLLLCSLSPGPQTRSNVLDGMQLGHHIQCIPAVSPVVAGYDTRTTKGDPGKVGTKRKDKDGALAVTVLLRANSTSREMTLKKPWLGL